MIYAPSWLPLLVFLAFVGLTLGLSTALGRRAKSSQGYFAAHGQIPWFVNGIAFAGDYLSAASFLGICGLIAFYGYDGFLYSIGYLAGWVVALFVIAEPIKRLGKFTFADALNARFQSKGIKIAAGISTLVVSLFYLIPQMVGAGVLVQPLLGLPHWGGVLLVGTVVVLIVVTAGMVSTTWVQFLKGALLVLFSTVLTVLILYRGLSTQPQGEASRAPRLLGPFQEAGLQLTSQALPGVAGAVLLPADGPWAQQSIARLQDTSTGAVRYWVVSTDDDGRVWLREAQSLVKTVDGRKLANGLPLGAGPGEGQLFPVGLLERLPDGGAQTGPLGPLAFLRTLNDSEVTLWSKRVVNEPDGTEVTLYLPQTTPGSSVLLPGASPQFKELRSERWRDKLNFLSLMLALFCGTASLPHILIRYYTVKDEASARKSTIVGIASIGFFYVLTLYLGLGAMTSGALDVTNNNMSAPLLARSINEWLFAIISAIAFTTVLGTVSGLILATAGAVSHDLLSSVLKVELTDHEKVRAAKLASVVVGGLAIALGIYFEPFNVTYLVGWAFSIAASANLPTLVMLLFWKRTTREGVIAAILVGMLSALGWILLSGDTYKELYKLSADSALVPFSQPGIVTIPLGFLTLVVVSLLTQRPADRTS